MDAERWKQIDDLLQSALLIPFDRRDDFLRQACAGLVSIYACVATALSLSRRRESDPVAGATTALAVLLVAQHPVNKMLPMAALGAAGLFPAFAAAISS